MFKKSSVIIFLIFIVLSCHRNKRMGRKDVQFFQIIDSFVNKHPIPGHFRGHYPSYNVCFNIYKKDTIMSIFLFPVASKNHGWVGLFYKEKWFKEFANNKKNHWLFKEEFDGVYWYKKKYPIVFSNIKLYKKYNDIHLSTLPDSLKIDNYPATICGNWPKWYFIYKNGRFIRNDFFYKEENKPK